MEAKELAERLKAKVENFKNVSTFASQLGHAVALAEDVSDDLDTILKALRALETVAGIEMLMASGFEVFIDPLSLPGQVVISYSENRDVAIGTDLHSAVFAAVEATKGGV